MTTFDRIITEKQISEIRNNLETLNRNAIQNPEVDAAYKEITSTLSNLQVHVTGKY